MLPKPCRNPLAGVKIIVFVGIATLVYACLKKWHSTSHSPEVASGITIFSDYTEALARAVGVDKTVLIAPFDSGFVDMAVNFYVSSIKKHSISNCLFIAMDATACDKLSRFLPGEKVTCVYYYLENGEPTGAAAWGTQQFSDRNFIKRHYMLDALRLGYTVLMSDVDIAYLQEPLGDLQKTCQQAGCDMAIQWDTKHQHYNGGFVYARPTPASISMYELQFVYDQNVFKSDQKQLNVAITELGNHVNYTINALRLNSTKYPVGKPFFPHRRCPPRDKYKGVIALHNNYLQEKENKIFRLKECMLWEYEGPDGYYSNPSRTYLTYQYNKPSGLHEYQGLLNAFSIAKLLNRTVILPSTFYRPGDIHTNLMLRIYQTLDMYFIRDFNELTGYNYRESSFLRNPKVPLSVRKSRSAVYHIHTGPSEGPGDAGLSYLSPMDTQGPTQDEILRWFGDTQHGVLQFDSLYGNFSQLDYEGLLGRDFVNHVRPLHGKLDRNKY